MTYVTDHTTVDDCIFLQMIFIFLFENDHVHQEQQVVRSISIIIIIIIRCCQKQYSIF